MQSLPFRLSIAPLLVVTSEPHTVNCLSIYLLLLGEIVAAICYISLNPIQLLLRP